MANLKNLIRLSNYLVRQCELKSSSRSAGFLKPVKSDLFNFVPLLSFHTAPRMNSIASEERRRARKAAQKIDLGIDGADQNVIDSSLLSNNVFPSYDIYDRLFDGVPFKDIPIVHIKCSRNNTILSLCENGDAKFIRSCGYDGFKNCRKGTNIAGQTTGYAFALKAVRKGYKNVRIVLNGLGPGRLSALKGLQLGGINMISITDKTINCTNQKPKNERRI